ncbi:MAG TPA: phenylalanine--tRNA ligase subunit beta [Nitrospiraceae bacterium]|nr:phenylalanine--tRNA ligase subunit beta [Nitrospiraceae bacterium]
MPTISIDRKDFLALLGPLAEDHPITNEQIELWLQLVKGELKDHNSETGELRIELQDSNRPDLWSCEGIARQIRIKLTGALSEYSFFHTKSRPVRRLTVAPDLQTVRPYVAACTAVGYEVTAAGLAQLIQVQEKLADIFGHKRRTVSIGLYRLSAIAFPIAYTLVKPDEVRFTPLGFDEKMTPQEILAVHPKGLEYGSILTGHDRLPLLLDTEGHVLSLPPIINSRELGEIRVGDRELLVEVTGTDLRMVLLTLNIMAVNLADRNAAIEAVDIEYPYETEFGKTVRTPYNFSKSRTLPMKSIESALGQRLDAEEIRAALVSYGFETTISRDTVTVTLPPYRNDVMHPVDVAEDVAISRGYGSFVPIMPSEFTVGGLSRLEQASDRIRNLMVGFGFQEMMSNLLSSRLELIDRMRMSGTPWGNVVEVENPMAQTYSTLRQSIVPSLLRVESVSTRSFYPHRLFEVGEVAIPDTTHDLGSRTVLSLGAMIAHAAANFSEIHSSLDLLLYYLGAAYTLEPVNHPSFLDGRVGQIVLNGQPIGVIGELHPEVLEQWQVTMPTVAFELAIDSLIEGT